MVLAVLLVDRVCREVNLQLTLIYGDFVPVVEERTDLFQGHVANVWP